MNKLITRDVVVGLILLVFSLSLYYWLIPNYVEEPFVEEISPRFFPKVSAIIIFLLSIILIINGLFLFNNSTRNEKFKLPIAFLKVLIVLFLFILVFNYLGFLFSSPLLLALLMFIFGARKLWVITFFSLLSTAFIFVMFNYILQVPLI